MRQWKDVGRQAAKSAIAIRRARRSLIEGLEQRMLLAAAPAVEWSSYLGGSSVDCGFGIAIDGRSNAWVAGYTTSTDLASAGFDTTYNGGAQDAFVAKISADGTLAWSSYLGASGKDAALDIAIDSSGNAWIVGKTDSTDLASGGFDNSYNGGTCDHFVAKINADGTLAWVSYLGGTAEEGEGLKIAIDSSGNAWITGYTSSTDFATGGFDTTYNGGAYDGFVAKIHADGTLAWSSYLGGSGSDWGFAIAIDADGNAWVAGNTESPGWTSGGFDTSFNGYRDGFVAEINPNGTLAWSSYLDVGPGGGSWLTGIAFDPGGNAWITGDHGSLAKINADETLAWSTHRDLLYCMDIAIDDNGNVWVSGGDAVYNPNPYGPGGEDAFVARISPAGAWEWLAYLPEPHRSTTDGGPDDYGWDIAIDAGGGVWVTGDTGKPGWTSGGFDTTLGGKTDAFIVKLSETPAVPHAPVAYDQSLSTQQNTALTGRMLASDPDGDPLTYSVTTQPAHGTLSYTPGGSFTYTPDTDYDGPDSFVYQASDGTRSSNPATVYITVTLGQDLDANLSLAPSSILENEPAGTAVGSFSVTGLDATGPFTYSLVTGDGDEDNASFTISGNQLLTQASFDYESKNSYSIRVRALGSGGLVLQQAFTVTVMNVNEKPTDIRLGNALVPENQPAGAIVGSLFSTDPDDGDTFTYTLVDGEGSDDNASFTISGNHLRTAASFSLADGDSYSIRVRSTDAGGLSFEKAFTIHIINTLLSSTCIPENQPAGTVVGTLSCTNPDFSSALSYELAEGEGSDDNASFAIVDDQLVTTAPLDYELKNTYSVRIRTTVAQFSYDNLYTISISDVNEAPTDIALSSTTIQENLPASTVVADFSTTDPDADDSFTYTLVAGPGDDDNASFVIDGNQLLTSIRFNYEFRTSYSVRAQVTDSGGLSTIQTFDINISDDPSDYRGAFGWTGGKKRIKLVLVDGSDGDLVTFKLAGTGTGKVYGFQDSFEDLFITGSGPKTAITITVKNAKVKKPLRGDKLMTLGNLSTEGLIKSLSATATILSGLTQLNTQDHLPAKAKASLKLRQVTDSAIRVQHLPIASIAVKGDFSNSRLVTNSFLKSFKAATLLDSEILVGVASDFTGDFATSAADFINPTTWLGNLKITGRKLRPGTPHPADVANSHISAPTVATITLTNVPATSDPILHVPNDIGTLKLARSKLTTVPMLAPSTWKTPGRRPTIWQLLPASAG